MARSEDRSGADPAARRQIGFRASGRGDRVSSGRLRHRSRQPRPKRSSAAPPSKGGRYGRMSRGEHGSLMWTMEEDRQPTSAVPSRPGRAARIVRRPGKRRRALSRPGPSTPIVEAGLFVRVVKVWRHTEIFGEGAGTRTPQSKCSSSGAIRQGISRFDSADDLSDPRAVPKSVLDQVRANRERQHCSRDAPWKYVRLLSSLYERINMMRERLTITLPELSFAHAFDIGRREISHAGRSEHLCS